jgi:hypothetical protein
MTPTTTPAELAINLFGGIRSLARAVDRDPAAISRWRKRGRIPASAQLDVLSAAEQLGIAMTADDIVRGRDVVAD